MTKQLFQITRHAHADQPGADSFTLPSGVTYLRRGTALGPSADGVLDLAQATRFTGFLCRDVNETGPTMAQLYRLEGPGGAGTPPEYDELPYKSGESVAVQKADEYEAEGVYFLHLSGTGAISSATAVGTRIEFLNGRARVEQTGGNGVFAVAAIITDTAKLADADANTFRVRFEAVR